MIYIDNKLNIIMSSNFVYLPPELWEYIITEYNLLNKPNIKTIQMIPSRHCIMETVYWPLIQQYIDYMCKLFYSTNNMSKWSQLPYIFNKENLFDIINYLTDNMTVYDLPIINNTPLWFCRTINQSQNDLSNNILLLKLNNKTVKIFKTICNEICILYFLDNKLHRTDGPAYIVWSKNGNKLYDIYYMNGNHYYR